MRTKALSPKYAALAERAEARLGSRIERLPTTTGELADPNGVPIAVANGMVSAGHVLSVSSLTVGAGATLRATGGAPLIIASWTDMTIAGAIDAGSKPDSRGAGSNPTECDAHVATRGGSDLDGGGGSGGGSGHGRARLSDQDGPLVQPAHCRIRAARAASRRLRALGALRRSGCAR